MEPILPPLSVGRAPWGVTNMPFDREGLVAELRSARAIWQAAVALACAVQAKPGMCRAVIADCWRAARDARHYLTCVQMSLAEWE